MAFCGQPDINKTVLSGAFGVHDPGYLNKSFYSFGAKHTNLRNHMEPEHKNLNPKDYANLLNKKFDDVKMKTLGSEKGRI